MGDQGPKESLLAVLFECGTVTVCIFSLSMVPYSLAVPLCPCDAATATCSWLRFWGVLCFTVCSGIDVACCLLFAREQSDDDVKEESSRAKFHQCLRRVHWRFWSALCFCIASSLYQAETLVDPSIVGPSPGQLLKGRAG